MKLTVYGYNYTGAIWRGLDGTDDGRFVKVTFVGDERQLVTAVLDNFGYGEDDQYQTLEQLKAAYAEHDLPNGDGCGFVLLAETEDGKRIIDDIIDEYGNSGKNLDCVIHVDGQPMDLGEVDLATCEKPDRVVNLLVRERV